MIILSVSESITELRRLLYADPDKHKLTPRQYEAIRVTLVALESQHGPTVSRGARP